MMKKYIVYDKMGMIVKSGACPEEMMPYQKIDESDCVIEGVINDATHRIDITTGEIIQREPETLPGDTPLTQTQSIKNDLIKQINALGTITDIIDFLKTFMVKHE